LHLVGAHADVEQLATVAAGNLLYGAAHGGDHTDALVGFVDEQRIAGAHVVARFHLQTGHQTIEAGGRNGVALGLERSTQRLFGLTLQAEVEPLAYFIHFVH